MKIEISIIQLFLAVSILILSSPASANSSRVNSAAQRYEKISDKVYSQGYGVHSDLLAEDYLKTLANIVSVYGSLSSCEDLKQKLPNLRTGNYVFKKSASNNLVTQLFCLSNAEISVPAVITAGI